MLLAWAGPFKVVGRGSETQPKVGEDFKYLIYLTYFIYQLMG